MREDPTAIIPDLEEKLKLFSDPKNPKKNVVDDYEADEGRPAILEMIEYAKNSPKIHPLINEPLLEPASMDHSKDVLKTGKLGHEGSDGSGPKQRAERYGVSGTDFIGENVGLISRYSTYKDVALMFAIDDGVHDRGHRDNMFEDAYNKVSCAAVLGEKGVIITLNYAEDFGTLESYVNDFWPNVLAMAKGEKWADEPLPQIQMPDICSKEKC